MATRSIAFFDLESSKEKNTISDIGCILSGSDQSFHGASIKAFGEFISSAEYFCGHNIFRHDLIYLQQHGLSLDEEKCIDTLYLSPLLFPKKPYHRLVKDDKLDPEGANNPLNDAINARDLFYEEVNAFNVLPAHLKSIYYHLLGQQKEFKAFFACIAHLPQASDHDPIDHIRHAFDGKICQNADLAALIERYPIELAYALAIIACDDRYSITPRWVLKNFPDLEQVLFLLRNNPCITGCGYCDQAFDAVKGLNRIFGFPAFRQYDGEPLQERAVQAALHNRSLLAIFPTGGGKSITFQLPALMAAEHTKGLTVVISPLQSLMKDQVDNLREKGITDVATINGLLDPIERGHYYEMVESGKAALLYISPESLRSASIERLMLSRRIERFVIDEAHCFSSWGQDFRVDYLYIGDFIRQLQEKKALTSTIPVSCFSATAKQKVIEDIRAYFKDKLDLDLELFTSRATRKNLHYKVYNKPSEEEKYDELRRLLEQKDCPTIIYVSRTKRVRLLTDNLRKDGFQVTGFHGKMQPDEKMKNQEAFMKGEMRIMVATSAFGMGVDKSDVGMVIHYEISDSLENYVQEAGRAGRDERLSADCYVLFNDEDLNKHFVLLNQTKITQNEIQQVWKAIKGLTKARASVSNSALEIARKAGWDDSVAEIETRVTSAIAALEDAGYVKRGNNSPRVFASSIISDNAQEAIDKIGRSPRFSDEKKKQTAVRLIKRLFSSKNQKGSPEDPAESRIDYLSDTLGVVKEEIIEIIYLLKEENILADFKDLLARIKISENSNRSLRIFDTLSRIELSMLAHLQEEESTYSLKAINELLANEGCKDCSLAHIRTIVNFWSVTGYISRKYAPYSKDHLLISPASTKEVLKAKVQARHQLAKFIAAHLYHKTRTGEDVKQNKEDFLVHFSVVEIKQAYEKQAGLFKAEASLKDVEDALFYLSRIDAIKIEGGFFVLYNKLNLQRLQEDPRVMYKKEDYRKLDEFYKNKVQQVHIVGEYARKMIHNYKDALQFADDYFNLNYSSFLRKYFPASRTEEISRTLTKEKFQKLFGALSPDQLKIINDNINQSIVVAAGPGSGKTRILVHKLASILFMEDVKHEQLLMLTFSRAAATEFKLRLKALIGNAAHYIEVKTFHSYCFDLLGKVGNLVLAENIIKQAIDSIRSGKIEPSQITKTMLVVDEAQDMNEDEFGLVSALMEQNEGMRVMLVGDDDQNIYEFRKADAKYMQQLLRREKSIKYELVENYRSGHNIIAFSNRWIAQLPDRLKHYEIQPVKQARSGSVRIRSHSHRATVPLVNELLRTDLRGSTCILTRTNEEAALVAGLLQENKIACRLIQSNDGFDLNHLHELRFFTDHLEKHIASPLIDDAVWASALQAIKHRFKDSARLRESLNLISQFDLAQGQRKYLSDWKNYLQESKLEDLIKIENEIIYVSTIHKAKGKEFDNIFMLLNKPFGHTPEEVRQFYVGFTRAKELLVIHCKGAYLHFPELSQIDYRTDTGTYPDPEKIALVLTMKDVQLGYFAFVQKRIDALTAGDGLTIQNNELHNTKGEKIVKFSKAFQEKLNTWQKRGYCIESGEVNFVVFWKDDEGKEWKVVLPKVVMRREGL